MGKQAFLSYCPKCGNKGIYENGNEICKYCGTKELPTKYDWDKWLFGGQGPLPMRFGSEGGIVSTGQPSKRSPAHVGSERQIGI